MTATTLTQPIATETIKTNFKFLPNSLVEITLEGSQSYFRGYGKVLTTHSLGYERVMLDNGVIIFLDRINKTLVEFESEPLVEFDFTEVYKEVLAA